MAPYKYDSLPNAKIDHRKHQMSERVFLVKINQNIPDEEQEESELELDESLLLSELIELDSLILCLSIISATSGRSFRRILGR